MSLPRDFVFDFSKKFEHLPMAPIVEAVVHWRARAQNPWEPESVLQFLSQRLSQYSDVKQNRAVSIEFIAGLDAPKASQTSEWTGVRLTDPLRNCIAQFNRDGLIFSQLEPYSNWEAFEEESRRMWHLFVELGAPSQVERLGVRYINKIALNSIEEVQDVLKEPPTKPMGLPLATFLYQSNFDVPGSPFGVTIRKAFEAAQIPKNAAALLILDIDIFTRNQFICDERRLDDYFQKIRHLKNGAFFSLLTEDAIKRFRGHNYEPDPDAGLQPGG